MILKIKGSKKDIKNFIRHYDWGDDNKVSDRVFHQILDGKREGIELCHGDK